VSLFITHTHSLKLYVCVCVCVCVVAQGPNTKKANEDQDRSHIATGICHLPASCQRNVAISYQTCGTPAIRDGLWTFDTHPAPPKSKSISAILDPE
jgi:hypothetical protein